MCVNKFCKQDYSLNYFIIMQWLKTLYSPISGYSLKPFLYLPHCSQLSSIKHTKYNSILNGSITEH